MRLVRESKQRNLVLSILKNCCDHPTADVVYERAREKMPNISLGTVYRNLNQLVEMGEIISIESAQKKVHFDGDVSSHQHFFCTKCGRVVDIFEKPALPRKLSDSFLVTESKCVYYGVCEDCI